MRSTGSGGRGERERKCAPALLASPRSTFRHASEEKGKEGREKKKKEGEHTSSGPKHSRKKRGKKRKGIALFQTLGVSGGERRRGGGTHQQ